MNQSDVDMRDAFFDRLYDIAKKDSNVIFLTADMGAFSLKRFKKNLKKQYFNVGVAEQNMVSVAAGLALSGKKVFIYSIVPFATIRNYEQIKVDLSLINLPVTIVGSGPGYAYNSDGPTHQAPQDIAAIRTLPNMTILSPSDSVSSEAFATVAYKNNGPTYVRLDKGTHPNLYSKGEDFSKGFSLLKKGYDLIIISTGLMTQTALNVSNKLAEKSIDVGVIDLYRTKPINEKDLIKTLKDTRKIITLEETSIVGGLGSIISEIITDNNLSIPLKRIASPDKNCYYYGTRDWIQEKYGLDINGIVKTITDWNISTDKQIKDSNLEEIIV